MHIFENVDDAILRLTNHSQNFHFPTRQNLVTANDIIKFSVQQNVFRALGLANHKPSVIYRNWATANFESLHTQLTNCQSGNVFGLIIKSYTDSFLSSWRTTTNEKLVYGPASKIVNLLIKTIQESSQFKVDSIIRFQHVPWDSYTLRPLRKIINELADTDYYINIPTTAAMSFVNSTELYDILEKAIFNLYDRLPGQPPTIYFDYFAWNDNH
ncbi:MAG: hypothetical protein JST23_04620 [Bacteroidetes bacterium]|nr:hypothetical protein [Bacteroidota bacterium]